MSIPLSGPPRSGVCFSFSTLPRRGPPDACSAQITQFSDGSATV